MKTIYKIKILFFINYFLFSDINIYPKTKEAIIYSNCAIIKNEIDLNLKKGINLFLIKNLPQYLFL